MADAGDLKSPRVNTRCGFDSRLAQYVTALSAQRASRRGQGCRGKRVHLDRPGERVADEAIRREGIAVWNADRNNRSKGIDGQFKISDARIKLRRLFPQIAMF
jgi:hypothetical protein